MRVLVQKGSSGCCAEVRLEARGPERRLGLGLRPAKMGAIPRGGRKVGALRGATRPFPPSQGFRLAIFRAGNDLPTVPFFMAEIIDSETLSGLGNTQKAQAAFFFPEHPSPHFYVDTMSLNSPPTEPRKTTKASSETGIQGWG